LDFALWRSDMAGGFRLPPKEDGVKQADRYGVEAICEQAKF
jgi:hypothetical protein